MNDVITIFQTSIHHHLAYHNQPIPTHHGITWIHAGNGLFKQGVNRHLKLMVQTAHFTVPGLVCLLPHAEWSAPKIPGALLQACLEHAQHAAMTSITILRPIEQQYFIVWHNNQYRWYIPPQDASMAHIRYQFPYGTMVIADIHSHHEMNAYFSATDNHDDTGLSISCVLGKIYTQPEITCRLNVYGDHQHVPASLLFDGCSLKEAA
jgi:PRTRC genetic system protein A